MVRLRPEQTPSKAPGRGIVAVPQARMRSRDKQGRGVDRSTVRLELMPDVDQDAQALAALASADGSASHSSCLAA